MELLDASGDEVARSLPGDDVVDHPAFNATRAVTVEARPAQIWLWLVQIGFDRAGWYSYDWVDNLGKKYRTVFQLGKSVGRSRVVNGE